MNVLITGANGQLGSQIRDLLKGAKDNFQIASSLWDNAQVVVADSRSLDITDKDRVIKYIGQAGTDIIINCAAMTNVNACEVDPDRAFAANSLGPRNLAIAAENYSCKLIHLSTDYVFSGAQQDPYVEWDLCDPINQYGKSKLLGEQYVSQFCRSYFIVRSSWVYGYSGNNFVKNILHKARTGEHFSVVNDQRGSPTNAEDLAYHILRIADTDDYGIYHCSGNGACTWYEFAEEIIQQAGVISTITPCTSEEYKAPARRPMNSVLDNCMLRHTIGDKMRHWREALKCYIKRYGSYTQ